MGRGVSRPANNISVVQSVSNTPKTPIIVLICVICFQRPHMGLIVLSFPLLGRSYWVIQSLRQ